MKEILKKIKNDINIKKQAEELGLPIWQAPSTLFIFLGIVIIAIMTTVYLISRKYDSPEFLITSEIVVVTVLFTIGNFIIQSVEQMARTNKMKSEFVSIASHQLKAPIAEINWEVELLLSKNAEGLGAKQKDLIERVSKSNERMGRLVNDLLDVARIDQGKLALMKDNFNIVELIEKVTENNQVLAKANNVEIAISKNGNIPIITNDRRRIGVVMDNLISNAIKYTKGNGLVNVSIAQGKNSIIICVKDGGVGIPKSQQEHVFEKFFRSENAARYQVSGTGLGLYISKNIVEQSGGEIWFHSEENRGSEFCFSLPLNNKN
jgi:two-component system, NtrC family, sensor histidine kinase KinB